jgi:hypothetical protein
MLYRPHRLAVLNTFPGFWNSPYVVRFELIKRRFEVAAKLQLIDITFHFNDGKVLLFLINWSQVLRFILASIILQQVLDFDINAPAKLTL